MDVQDPSLINTTPAITNTEYHYEHEHKTNWVAIILGILVFILLAAAIIFLILWLIKRDRSRDTDLPDENVTVLSDSSASVTWNGTSDVFDKDDKINIYATTNPNYKIKDGVVTTKSGQPVEAKVTGIDPTTGRGTITGLAPNKKTYIITTVTDDNKYAIPTSGHELIFTQTEPPTDEFTITPLAVDGFLGFEPRSGNVNVYNSGTTGINGMAVCGSGNGKWNFDTNTKELKSTCNNTTYCLNSSNGVIQAGPCNSSSTKWIYTNNHWCENNSTTATNSNCLAINNFNRSAPYPVSIRTTSQNNSQNNRWANI